MMRWLGRSPKVNHEVVQALSLGSGERALAAATDDSTGQTIVATSWRLVGVADGRVVWQRPWTEVDAGQWDPDTWTLSVTWVDRTRAGQWSFHDQETRMPEVFHERVQASVVLSAALGGGDSPSLGRVVIRKDLRTGQLFEQQVLSRRARADDPAVQAVVAQVSADLRDQVGL